MTQKAKPKNFHGKDWGRIKRTSVNFSDLFMNFVSSFAQQLHGNSVCTGYVP
jgi:hypothetical protein